MADIHVSIIVPVYNSEEYLRTAIESLLSQDFENFEILLIDDGSTDKSGQICDLLAETAPGKVLVFHKNNSGMCGARNYGLSQARGEYITFMDNDDECLKGFIKDNYLIAKTNNADCVRFGRVHEIISPSGKVVSSKSLKPSRDGVFKKKEIAANYREIRENGNGVWSGMYKASFLRSHSILFDERLRHGNEDTLFNLSVYREANVIALNSKNYYVWKQRMAHSSSMTFPEDFFLGIYLAINKEIALTEYLGVEDFDINFASEKVGVYLREALSAFCRSSNRISWKEAFYAFEIIRDIFSEDEILKYRDGLSYANKIMLDLLLRKRYRILYSLVNFGYFIKNRNVSIAARS